MAATAKPKSKFFRVFTEGHTTDGRIVERQWISDIVATYNTAKYAARIWMEHIRGISPDSPFGAYGDVLAVKAEEVDGKLTLFAQLAPTDELIALNKKKQKLFTSVEIDPDFAKSGQCYLVGLAVTDSPASLGTDMLEFSAKAEVNPLASRKQRAENLFTAAVEFELELDEELEDKPSIFAKVSDLLNQFKKKSQNESSDVHQAVEAIAAAFAEAEHQFSQQLSAGQSETAELKTALATLKKDFSELQSKLATEESPQQFRRSKATGGNSTEQTDC
jgi:Xaa-Pro aminopeptidase